MSDTKRLTDEDAAKKWDALDRYVESADERREQALVRADHLQAREDVKRLAENVRARMLSCCGQCRTCAEDKALLDEVGR